MENTEFNYSLSTKNLKGIPFDMYEKDFTFFVDGKTYKTNRFVADLLSPIIRQMHYSDQTFNEFYISTQPKSNNTNDKLKEQTSSSPDYFNEFLQLNSFNDIKIDSNKQTQFSLYFYALGNIDEFFKIQPKYFDDLTVENAIERLEKIANLLCENMNTTEIGENEGIKRIIDFISANFEQFEQEKMKRIDIDVVEMIVSSDKMRLHDEDSLLRFILNLYEEDRSYSRLFEYVMFNNVSEEMIRKFIEKFDINDIDSNIWRSFCTRVLNQVDDEDVNRYENKTKENIVCIEHEEGRELEGILRHLTNETGSNIHDNGTIEITSNSITCDSQHPKNLVDFQNDNSYHSKGDGNSFVCFDFKEKSVKLTSYSIKANSNGSNSNNLKNWVIEASNDNNKWYELDQRTNDSSLKGSKVIVTFKIKKQNDNFYRLIRLRQTGETWGSQGNQYFWFLNIDFYGKVKYIQNNTNK